MSSSTRVAYFSSTIAPFALEPVVRDGEERAAQRVEMGDGGRVGVGGGLLRGVAARRSPIGSPMRWACQVCQVAGWVLKYSRDVARDVRVGARVAGLRAAGGDGVVDVVGRLLPGVEDDLLVGVVRVQRGDDALDRVVEQHRADAGVGHLALGFVQMRGAEERLVLPDRLALVVEDRPARADPAARRVGLHRLALRVAHQVAGPMSPVGSGTWAWRCGASPGSAWIFFWISRPKPSE